MRKELFLVTLCMMFLSCAEEGNDTSVQIIPAPSEVALTGKMVAFDKLTARKLVIDKSMPEEAYELRVSRGKISIKAGGEAGLFYAQQSIEQERQAYGDSLKVGRITDAPRFEWRGVMLDESRHFFGKETVKSLLDMMARYKLNKLHWHLTDSPGWRLEIKQYPLLTEVGGKGTHSNPDAPAAFYTQDDIREILAYAEARHIMVIPEIDMPGHAAAANRAYPEYSGGGSKKHPDFTFNPGKEETYVYLTNILKEVVQLFPAPYIHIGGDEVFFGTDDWDTDQAIQQLIADKKLDGKKGVERYFIERMDSVVHSLGKTLIGWDDVAEFNIDFERDIACWWHHNMPERLTRLYEKKMSVVLTPRMPMYFDYRQNESHKYGMRHWGTVTLDNVYAFPQDSVLAPTTKGLEACVWTEFIPDVKRLDYMVYPRLPAMAEAAWTDKARKHFDDFLLRLKREMVYYDSKGINYYQYFSPEGQEEPAPTLNDVFKD